MSSKEKPAEVVLDGLSNGVRLAAEHSEHSPLVDVRQRLRAGVHHGLTLRTLQNDDGHFVGLEAVR